MISNGFANALVNRDSNLNEVDSHMIKKNILFYYFFFIFLMSYFHKPECKSSGSPAYCLTLNHSHMQILQYFFAVITKYGRENLMED